MTLDTGARAAIFVAHGMACVSVTANNQYPTDTSSGGMVTAGNTWT